MTLILASWIGFSALLLIIAGVSQLLGPVLDRIMDRAFGVDPLERAWEMPAVIPKHEQAA
jgi:hypothetical protein